MRFPFFQLDAFGDAPFSGNPAAVCVPPEDVGEERMQAIAAQLNLSETAFLRPSSDGWAIRWFTPRSEVDLCGHATLASGAVVLDRLEPGGEQVSFASRSGPLGVARRGGRFELDFPAWAAQPADEGLARSVAGALGARPDTVLHGHYLAAVFGDEAQVRALAPDMEAVARLPAAGLAVTAPGAAVDFVSRFFAPALGVPEDPATGSAHCLLAPWWAARLGTDRLEARQLSARGGWLHCEVHGGRVRIAGRVRLVIEGEFTL